MRKEGWKEGELAGAISVTMRCVDRLSWSSGGKGPLQYHN